MCVDYVCLPETPAPTRQGVMGTEFPQLSIPVRAQNKAKLSFPNWSCFLRQKQGTLSGDLSPSFSAACSGACLDQVFAQREEGEHTTRCREGSHWHSFVRCRRALRCNGFPHTFIHSEIGVLVELQTLLRRRWVRSDVR